jgi:hypothetical protein
LIQIISGVVWLSTEPTVAFGLDGLAFFVAESNKAAGYTMQPKAMQATQQV